MVFSRLPCLLENVDLSSYFKRMRECLVCLDYLRSRVESVAKLTLSRSQRT